MLNDSGRCCKLLLQHCKQLEHPSFRLQNNLNFHHFYTHSAAFYFKVCPILFLWKFRQVTYSLSDQLNIQPMKPKYYNIQICQASKNACLTLSFMKDNHIVGKNVTRNGRKTAIYQLLFFCELAKSGNGNSCILCHNF